MKTIFFLQKKFPYVVVLLVLLTFIAGNNFGTTVLVSLGIWFILNGFISIKIKRFNPTFMAFRGGRINYKALIVEGPTAKTLGWVIITLGTGLIILALLVVFQKLSLK